MCLSSFARQAFGVFVAATSAMACGYDWGTVQRVGSCANCEILVKVEGIFDSNAVPSPQALAWQKEPVERAETSLLSNFSFRDDLQGWTADEGASQTFADAAISTTGSWQCVPAQSAAPYQLLASVRLASSSARAAISLEFFDGQACGGRSLERFTSPSVSGSKLWETLSMHALSPTASRSVRAQLATVSTDVDNTTPALFDNVILRTALPSP
ncbi:MAG: hypothetical protein SF187_11730 [Deltaproteobacteria bacterium]|nr:hypothetical protein [Deltaproteobacteria bacterium]